MRALERGAPCCTCSASRPQHSRQPCALPLHSSGGNHSLRRLALHLPPPRRSVTMALLPPPEPRQALAGVDAPPSTSVSVPALAEPALGPPLAVPRDGFKVVRAAVYHSGPDPVPVFTALQGLFPDVYASNTGTRAMPHSVQVLALSPGGQRRMRGRRIASAQVPSARADVGRSASTAKQPQRAHRCVTNSRALLIADCV